MSTILITGGNRGIGLELCRQFAQRNEHVITTCRRTSSELENLDIQTIEGIDISNPDHIETLKQQINGIKIDTLIHNAGILSRESLDDLNFDQIEQQFRVNTLGPLRVVHGLLENFSPGTKIGILSSRMGSMGDNGSGGMYGYRISKAGTNALGVSLARDLAPREISVAILHPGMVATDMTNGNGIDPVDSARGLIERIDGLTLENSGTFWHAEGYILPW